MMLSVEEISSLNWFSHACCLSVTTVNTNGPVYAVNHQGGKTRQSHLLWFPALCYCIHNAFDSALCGAVKTNAILTALFGVCMCVLLLGADGNAQAKATSQIIAKRTSISITPMYWDIHFVCALMCAHTVFIC